MSIVIVHWNFYEHQYFSCHKLQFLNIYCNLCLVFDFPCIINKQLHIIGRAEKLLVEKAKWGFQVHVGDKLWGSVGIPGSPRQMNTLFNIGNTLNSEDKFHIRIYSKFIKLKKLKASISFYCDMCIYMHWLS